MRWLAAVFLVVLALAPHAAEAHDDPIVTVRVLCNGFNVLDLDAVLGELSDSASIHFDRSVQGSQIQAWVREQMDKDLRIEITEIGTPQKLSDGYTLTWTARLSRQDWRASGLATRTANNTVVIHNARITEWTTTFDSDASQSSSSAVAKSVGVATPTSSGFPEVFGVPVTLLLAGLIAVGGASFVVRTALRR